jgi:hypothetical protein
MQALPLQPTLRLLLRMPLLLPRMRLLPLQPTPLPLHLTPLLRRLLRATPLPAPQTNPNRMHKEKAAFGQLFLSPYSKYGKLFGTKRKIQNIA